MDFTKTQTYLNLARSFAGESQAGMRYQLIARTAMQQGYEALANTIRTLAKNETNHARVFFEALLKHAGSQDNIQIEAGYPFHSGTIEESLRFAAEDERNEHERIYPNFAKIAREEGFAQIALKFEQIAKVESHHEIILNYLYEALKNGTLYSADQPVLWVCGECGHMHTTNSAWNICPLCGASQGEVQLHLPFAQTDIS